MVVPYAIKLLIELAESIRDLMPFLPQPGTTIQDT